MKLDVETEREVPPPPLLLKDDDEEEKDMEEPELL
jgi:hypothetical protein